MKKSIFFFAAVAALFSCAKENPVSDTPAVNTPAEETFSIEIKATAPSDGNDAVTANDNTRSTLVDGGVDADGKPKKFVYWSKGDAIKVLLFPNTVNHNAAFDGPSGVFVSNFSQESAKSAGFRCDAWSWGSKVTEQGISKSLQPNGIAIYPATATATSSKPYNMYVTANTEVSFILPSNQNAVKDNIESNLNFSYANVSLTSIQQTVENGADTDVTFNNACAMIELTLPSSLDKKVTSVSLKSNTDVPLTGKGTVKLTGHNNIIASPFGVDVTEGNGVVLNNANGFEAGAKYYAVVWPGNHTSGLTITFTAEDGTKATKTTGAVELTASKVKPYTFNKGLVFESASYDYYYSDATVGNDPNPAGKSVIGVIFYNGNPRNLDATLPSSCTHGLAISVKKAQLKWHTANLPNSNYTNYGLGNKSGNIWGYEAKHLWKHSVGMDLNLFNISSPIPSLPVTGDYVSETGWYHATNCELSLLAADYARVKDLLAACSGDALPTSSNSGFWTPLANSTSKAYLAYYQSYSNSFYLSGTTLTYAYYIYPIFAF